LAECRKYFMNKFIKDSVAAALCITLMMTGCSSSGKSKETLKTASETNLAITAVNQTSSLEVQMAQKDAPMVDIFEKTVTVAYKDGGKTGTGALHGKQMGDEQNIDVMFIDGIMYQKVDDTRYIKLELPEINAANVDAMQAYTNRLPLKISELENTKEQKYTSSKDGDNTVITNEISGETAKEFAGFLYVDFILGDEIAREESKKAMIADYKNYLATQEDAPKYTDEELNGIADEQVKSQLNAANEIVDNITINKMTYTATVDSKGIAVKQVLSADIISNETNFILTFTDTLENANGEPKIKLDELNEETLITFEEYQQEMMMEQFAAQINQQMEEQISQGADATVDDSTPPTQANNDDELVGDDAPVKTEAPAKTETPTPAK
ncbi:MAG: hypothetical protein RR205_03885, partial [Oscillospiraceae bacterium]